MATNTLTSNGILSPVIYNTSKALERASYYGIRSLLVIYMVGYFGIDRYEAMNLYGWSMTIYLIALVLGAVVGDLLLGNKYTAIAGGILQAFGAFIICLPSTATLYIGIGMVFFGSGIYGSNLFSMIGRYFRKREKILDSGMTVYYTVINVGAFIGTMVIGYLGENNFHLGFIAAGILMVISSVMLFFTKDTKTPIEEHDITKKNLPKSVVMVFMAMAITAIFWLVYEIAGSDVFSKSYELRELSGSGFLRNIWQSINPVIVLLAGILLSVVWYFIRSNRILKLGIGFLLGATSYFILLTMPEGYSWLGVAVFLISALLLGFAEILFAPTTLSLLSKYTNPKYLAIIFALYMLPTRILSAIYGLFSENIYNTPNLGLIIGGIILFILAVGLVIYALVFKESITEKKTS
ncbi:MAG: MFS transporter [Flavobacteriaceae bacterium]|nr:MFS transporter [Flavobacteriaceae bacterium]